VNDFSGKERRPLPERHRRKLFPPLRWVTEQGIETLKARFANGTIALPSRHLERVADEPNPTDDRDRSAE
jgi:hypothetical protein